MSKFDKAKAIGGIVFYGIWLFFSIGMWFAGLDMFRGAMGTDDAFVTWIIWGALCVFPIIIPVIKNVISSVKSGARDGANTYSASISGNTVTVQNHPLRGAFFGLIGGILGGLLVGPVILPIYIIANITKLIKCILDLVKAVKEA